MKQKKYEKPSIEVVRLQVQNQLLAGSPETQPIGTQNYQVKEEVNE